MWRVPDWQKTTFRKLVFVHRGRAIRCKSALVPRCGLSASIPHATFLQKSFKIFGRITSKLLEVFDEMRLIEEVVFVTDFGQRFGFA